MVWGSLHIRRRIEGPVGERTCTRGPASRRPGSVSGWEGWGGSSLPSLRTAPHVAVKLAGALYPVVGQSVPTGRRLVRLEPKTLDCEAGPQVP